MRQGPSDALTLADEGRGADARLQLEKTVELEPAFALAQFRLALLCESLGDPARAAAAYRAGLAAQPDHAPALNNLAWLLLTTPALRDPAEALRLAVRADDLAAHADPVILDTLEKARAAVK